VADTGTFDRAGMWINMAEGGFKIVDVTKGGPAEVAGLKASDIIAKVDGKPAADVHLYDLRKRLRNDMPDTIVTFTVKDGSTVKNVKVTLRDQI
jgi:putative serine protease PepD